MTDYTTRDLNLAAFLVTLGHRLDRIDRSPDGRDDDNMIMTTRWTCTTTAHPSRGCAFFLCSGNPE